MKKIFEKFCKQCHKKFTAANVRALFCCGACKTKNFKDNNPKEYEHKCLVCEKIFTSPLKNTKFCSQSCSAKRKNAEYDGFGFCKNCGEKFKQKHKRNFFCSTQCRSIYNGKHMPTAKTVCAECESILNVPRKKMDKQQNFFCNKICESNFRERNADDSRMCEWCKSMFYCKKHDKLRFCGTTCQSEWQKTRTGEKSPTFNFLYTKKDREMRCKKCGKIIIGTPKEFEKKKYCSAECRIASIGKSLTKPHKIAIGILKSMKIKFDIEKKIGNYYIDCLVGDSLCVEVMGDYWHCNPLAYQKPINKMQSNGIKKDHKKRSFLTESGYSVLYLWECDLMNEPEMCKKLISKFIESNGILENFNSTNYFLLKRRLFIREDIIIHHIDLI